MVWFLLTAAFATDEANCNGIDDDYDGWIDEGASCATPLAPCLQTAGTSGDSFVICDGSGTSLVWDDAAFSCAALGYDLATPRNTFENDLLTSQFLSDAVYWFGISDEATEGTWVDAYGDPLAYENWGAGRPDGGTAANCGAYAADQLWDDLPCVSDVPTAFVCEARCNPVAYYIDSDGDGYGAGSTQTACDQAPSNAASQAGDCEPSDSDSYPGAPDATCDGVDNDCDGSVDEDAVGTVWHHDADGDGYGDPADTVTSCIAPANYVADASDCDDADVLVNPGEVEVCDGIDNDCSNGIDDGLTNTTYYADDDTDGYGDEASPLSSCSTTAPSGYAIDPGDCDDNDSHSYPGAPERCDSADNDCDGTVDENAAPSQWYEDGDGDGWGTGPSTTSCDPPTTTSVLQDGDCDDSDIGVNPGAPEICDSEDHDCDGEPWNGLTVTQFYPDVDQDGYGAGNSISTCAATQPGYASNDLDCDDTDEHVSPDAVEICDGIDNDCDALTDDDDDSVTGRPVWYTDLDDDGFGEDGSATASCIQPPQTVDRDGDCDDSQPNVFVGAPEACVDGLDNDCDTLIDQDDDDFVNGGAAYAQDADDDGFGDPNVTTLACSGEQPLGWIPLTFGEDCDDASSLRSPALDEVCDGIDNDCVNGVDNDLPFLDYYVDNDEDGFGDPGAPTVNACEAPLGRTGNGLDCDDDDPDRHPGATEVCDGIDNDCNNTVDDGPPTDTYYPDLDGDGYGDAASTGEASCAVVDGAVTDNTDCDDTDVSINPGAPDDPIDGIDSNCDGEEEEVPPARLVDTDGDGVPDVIDLVEPTGAQPPEPTPADYGCGCTQSPQPGGWLSLWWRR